MAAIALAREERIGLGLALAAHAGLFAWLAVNPPATAPAPAPERMTVTLSDDVGLTSTAPQPAPAPAPDEAPMPGDQLPPPMPLAVPQPAPAPVQRAVPAPARPAPIKAAPAKALPPTKSAPAPARQAGGSRIGDDFLKGVSGAQGQNRAPATPAAAAGPQVRSALSAAILRQIKPKWQGRVPQGVDTEKLVSVIAIELNPDGTLNGTPRLLSQDGINDANRAQARRHAEEAIRAVQLAAPFSLPSELYEAWKKPPALRMRKSI
ncbi:cell division and transport-associated protein TolA [Novosphingobium kunmingense]|uniref:Cell division and transport-associated protein TolA n=1 Tax=Novosphingobium kunmingense TaxID=1211806 RepID=A0A2N0HJN5_9SPHN|nr:hypothetical protein [Novosphingobium kunmingense]PKB19085.1 cell division and transport-associated protein TolA [Novosphingobium kunmingense]